MGDKLQDFPLEIEPVEDKVVEEIHKYYKGERGGFVRVGPHKYVFTEKYVKEGPRIYNMPLRSDDIFVATYPRSGTTWTQELVWLLANNLDYKTAAELMLVQRYVFVEFSSLVSDGLIEEVKEENKDDPRKCKALSSLLVSGVDSVASMPSPRFIKTHLPFSLLPPNTLDTSRVIYVARDPREVAVSFYHHNRLIRVHNFVGDFKTYWRHFINNMYIYTPAFPHLKEAWQLRNHPNMLFLFYHEMVKDLPAVARRVAKFLGKEYNDQEIADLCEHLDVKNFKKNQSCNLEYALDAVNMKIQGEASFIREGKTGSWRSYFDEEMTKQAEDWMAENLKDTDLRFPS